MPWLLIHCIIQGHWVWTLAQKWQSDEIDVVRMATSETRPSSPIIWAMIQRNHDEAMRLAAIMNGMELAAVDVCGLAPMHLAVYIGDAELVRFLVMNRGVSTDVISRNGLLPVQFVRENETSGTIISLLSQRPRSTQ